MEPEIFDPSQSDYKHKQQDLTELNADGNRDRDSEGNDLGKNSQDHPNCGTPDCCGQCDTASFGDDD